MLAHADASASIDLIDHSNLLLDQMYARWPAARDWLQRLRENNGLLKRNQRDVQRHMKALLDDEQKKRTDTDRLGKLKQSND